MKKLILVSLLVSTSIGCSGRQLSDNDISESAVFKSAGDVDYFKPMEGAPIEFGMAYGNTFKSDHGTLGKFPKNFETPLHTHTNSYHAVVIEGSMTNPMQGQSGKAKCHSQGFAVESCIRGESVFAAGPASCTLICGHFECDRSLKHPLLEELPDCIYLENGGSLNNHWLDGAVSMLIQETSGAGSGFEAITSRLAEILFIQIIQAYIHEHGIESGFLAALSDKQICRALHYVHNNYSSEVSVNEMARIACMSRTSLSAKFNALVGMPPGTYTAKWRMLKASELLCTTGDSISAVALQVGYRDESAFSRAFRNEYGSYPGAWRREMLALGDQVSH